MSTATRKLKAYRVENDEWWSLVYAETAAKAKYLELREYGDYDGLHYDTFEALAARRAIRVPECDQFATETPSVDNEAAHQILAGILIECSICEREINPGDAWGYSETTLVVCGACLAKREREG